MLKRPVVRAAVLGIALLGTAVAWYLISPLFIRALLPESFPTLGLAASHTPPQGTPAAMQTADAERALMLESASTLLLAHGDFYEVAQTGRGTANIYLLEDGRLVLGLEAFEVTNGPNLHVVLTTEDPVGNTEVEELEGALDLGELKGIAGDQYYTLPANQDLTPFRSVVIWSQLLASSFIAAPIQIPNL